MRLLASFRATKFVCPLTAAFILAVLPMASAAAETSTPSIAQAGSASSVAESGVTSSAPQTGSSAYTSGRAFSAQGAPAQAPTDASATGPLPAPSTKAAELPPSKVLVTIDKATQTMKVFVDNLERYDWAVSTGKRGYDTPSGSYTARSMNEIWYSKQWDAAPMPHAIFFTKKGHAIHGTLEIRNLGRPASHGCVRIAPENATTLFALVKQVGIENTEIVLSGEVPPPKAKVASFGAGKQQVKAHKKTMTALKKRSPSSKAKVASSAPSKQKVKPSRTYAYQGYDPRAFEAPRQLSRRELYRLYYSGPPQYQYPPYSSRRRYVVPGY